MQRLGCRTWMTLLTSRTRELEHSDVTVAHTRFLAANYREILFKVEGESCEKASTWNFADKVGVKDCVCSFWRQQTWAGTGEPPKMGYPIVRSQSVRKKAEWKIAFVHSATADLSGHWGTARDGISHCVRELSKSIGNTKSRFLSRPFQNTGCFLAHDNVRVNVYWVLLLPLPLFSGS